MRRILIGRCPRRTLLRALLVAAVLTFVGRVLVRPALTRGSSMEPTVADGSFHLLNLQAYRKASPAYGDIVAIRMYGGRSMYLKRVLGVPGDRLAFEEGRLIVNDRPREEPYVRWPGPWNLEPITLGAQEYFVAGDNRSTPVEAHLIGVVQRADIAGKLLW